MPEELKKHKTLSLDNEDGLQHSNYYEIQGMIKCRSRTSPQVRTADFTASTKRKLLTTIHL
jgi:hypothetical protein